MGEREAEDDLETAEREPVGQGSMDELEYGQNGGTKQGGLDRQRDGLMCLLAQKEMIINDDGDDSQVNSWDPDEGFDVNCILTLLFTGIVQFQDRNHCNFVLAYNQKVMSYTGCLYIIIFKVLNY